MDTTALVNEVDRAGQRLADAADGHLDTPVPSCPEWTITDLVAHVGGVLSFWAAVVAGRATNFEDFDAPDPPPPDEVVDWYRASVKAAVRDLGSVDPSVERWNWSGSNQTAAWIQRRMAHELAVHAWDGVNAVGNAEPIPVAMAVDGIDEFLELFAPFKSNQLEGPPFTIHLHTTDTDGEWLIAAGDGAMTVERAHAKGDVAARASASDLLLMLWGRVDGESLEVFGDHEVLGRFVRAMRI